MTMSKDNFLGTWEYFEGYSKYILSAKCIEKIKYYEITSANFEKLSNDLPRIKNDIYKHSSPINNYL